jgi:predicted ester cyclase
MSVQNNERLLHDYVDALISGRDFAAYFSDDVLWTTMETGEEVRGRDTVRQFVTAMHVEAFKAAPELRNTVVGEQGGVIEAVFVGTHIGEIGGIPATGAEVRLPYTVCYDFADDKITALRAYLPMAVMMDQLKAAARG